MKITVTNPNNIVQNALIKQHDLSLSLFINTVDKWVMRDSVMSGFHPTEEDGYFKRWIYYTDSVSLIAESEDDKAILGRIRFEHQNKDQLWILFPKHEVYT